MTAHFSSHEKSKEVDKWLRLIVNNIDASLAKGLCIHSRGQSRFGIFVIVIDALAKVDDKRHATCSTGTDVFVNMALAISARDLYEKCKTEALKKLLEEDMPSLSLFHFQFWPKDASSHTAFNYMG